jgi:hypothetical protein
MARGIPVLASDQGGLPDAKLGVDHIVPVSPVPRWEPRLDVHGLPVPVVPAQDIGPWDTALRPLLEHEEKRQALAAESYQAASRFIRGIDPHGFSVYIENLKR